MTKIFLILLTSIAICVGISAQTRIGVELYNYIKAKPAFQPIGYLQTADDWYAELRYNYEDEKTFSIYGGKTFSGGNNIQYNITPMVGFSTGLFTGVSFATNLDAEWKKIYFSSQSQYSMDVKRKDSSLIKESPANFFFSWSEAGYTISDNFYAGLALQYTLQKGLNEFSPGLSVGIRLNKFQLPVYIFSPFQQQRYFIIGLIYEHVHSKKK